MILKASKRRHFDVFSGWFIQYIDKEEELRKQKEQEKKQNDADDEERMLEFVQRQAERSVCAALLTFELLLQIQWCCHGKMQHCHFFSAKEAAGDSADADQSSAPTELIKTDDQKIGFALSSGRKAADDNGEAATSSKIKNVFDNGGSNDDRDVRKRADGILLRFMR